MTIANRLADADLLWCHGHLEGALLSALLAVQATARKTHPDLSDRVAFERFLRRAHSWTISVEHRGRQVDSDHLFYKWLRCELVHAGSLPCDLRIDDQFAETDSLAIRAGGPPDFTVLVAPGWFQFLVQTVAEAPVNADLKLAPFSIRPAGTQATELTL